MTESKVADMRKAFDRLYARHKGTVFRFVSRSVASKADAEEIFQEVWMKAIEARARYEPRAKFTTWIYAIAHNRLVDLWRKKGIALVPVDGGDAERPAIDRVTVVETALGWVAAAWAAKRLSALVFRHRSAEQAVHNDEVGCALPRRDELLSSWPFSGRRCGRVDRTML